MPLTAIQIYATVGTEQKVQYLQETFDIPRENIYESRNASFVDGIRSATGGQGVDIVLNSLSESLLHASWSCVAKFGKMIELGKRDFMGHGMLDMETFGANRSFIGVDLLQLGLESPTRSRRYNCLASTLMTCIANKTMNPDWLSCFPGFIRGAKSNQSSQSSHSPQRRFRKPSHTCNAENTLGRF